MTRHSPVGSSEMREYGGIARCVCVCVCVCARDCACGEKYVYVYRHRKENRMWYVVWDEKSMSQEMEARKEGNRKKKGIWSDTVSLYCTFFFSDDAYLHTG